VIEDDLDCPCSMCRRQAAAVEEAWKESATEADSTFARASDGGLQVALGRIAGELERRGYVCSVAVYRPEPIPAPRK
jgi:hypothetical protein